MRECCRRDPGLQAARSAENARTAHASRRSGRVALGFRAGAQGSIIQLVAIGLVAGAICTAVALAIPWLPVAAGRGGAAGSTSSTGSRRSICDRASSRSSRPSSSTPSGSSGPARTTVRRPADPRPHELEIVWTAIPAVLVTAISIVSAIVLAKNGHAGTNPLIDQRRSRSSSPGSSRTRTARATAT